MSNQDDKKDFNKINSQQQQQQQEENNWMEELEQEIEEMSLEEAKKDEILDNRIQELEVETLNLKDLLARKQADYDNYTKRVERDKQDMWHFLSAKILLKILPRLDDIERILAKTPDSERNTPIYEWLLSLEKALKRDLEDMWVIPFDSIGHEINPDKHDVISQAPGEANKIIDEFEKWYNLSGKLLRPAKVIVWMWE